MKKRLLSLWPLLLFLLSEKAGAESWWDAYTAYWDKIIERVLELDLYGNSAQLPQGLFSFKVDWNMRRAVGRHDSNRRRQPMAPPIAFGEEGNEMLMLDLGASGEGGGVTMQFSYGITDPLDFYIELPFVYLDVEVRPKLRKLDPLGAMLINGYLPADYPHIDYNWFEADGRTKQEYLNQASAWLLGYLPRLGRPTIGDPENYPEDLGPGAGYHPGGLILSDINLGFSWNFYRSRRWSGSFTGRVYLPTGRVSDPNNSLTLGTGPAIDWGTGSFGVGFTQDYDVRIFEYGYWVSMLVSFEFTAAYYFKSHRRYPSFPKPTEDGNKLLDLLDPDRAYFPDLSELSGKSYGYTPGVGVGGLVQLGVSSLIFDVGVGIGYTYFQEPEYSADPRFVRMVQALELSLAGHTELMQVAAGVNLIPFYIPLQIHYKYEKNIGGRNTLIFDRNHWVTIKGYLPAMF